MIPYGGPPQLAALAALVLLLSRQPAHAAPALQTTVHGDTYHGASTRVEGDELRTLPGALGDPFRALGLLPGVSTPIQVLPYYAIRGASPGMTGFYLDDLRLPALFHLLAGGAMVHPGLIERLDLYPGAYDASIGHQASGVIQAQTRPARRGFHGEVEVRLFDASAVAELGSSQGLGVTLSGRYGYPGPIISAIDPRIDVSYWDYQLRLDYRGLTIQALGASDWMHIDPSLLSGLDLPGELLQIYDLRISFHRVQARLARSCGRVHLLAAVFGGYDQTGDTSGSELRKLSAGLRARARITLPHLQLLAGVDGELARFEAQAATRPGSSDAPWGRQMTAPFRDALGDLGRDRLVLSAGAFVQGTLDVLGGRLQLTAGGRVDVYTEGAIVLIGLDPRLTLRARPTPWLTITAGGGVYQQPPSYPVMLPAFDGFALQLGLQRAIHAAIGQELTLPASFTLSATGYYQRLSNASNAAAKSTHLCRPAHPDRLSGSATQLVLVSDGAAYGMEVLLRRHAGRVTGWIGYTLSRSERSQTCGLVPTDHDQTHVLNVVLRARLPWRLWLGARLMIASGRPVTRVDPSAPLRPVYNNDRLPAYVQLDLRLDRTWTFRHFSLSAFIEVVNLTYAQTQLDIEYPKVRVQTTGGPQWIPDLTSPQIVGFHWVLPSLGARATF